MIAARLAAGTLALLCVASPALSAESETRGVLFQIRGRSVRILRDADGEERRFQITDSTPCYRGTSHQVPFDYSQINPGTAVRIRHEGALVTAIYQ